MQSRDARSVFYYQSSASALGGYLEKPFEVSIPSQAAAVLPGVGGFATSNSEAFNLHNIVSCSRASARVASRRSPGGVSIVATSVVENLNILEVVTADKVVGQASVEYTPQGRRFSLAGTRFEGLRLGGREAGLVFDDALLSPECVPDSDDPRLNWDAIREVGRGQALELHRVIDDRGSGKNPWALHRYEWMEKGPKEDAKPGVDTYTLCSIVKEVSRDIPCRFGHIVEIPEFGRIFLGEFLVSGTSFQLSMIRAELGCTVVGGVHVGMNGGGGHSVPPVSSY